MCTEFALKFSKDNNIVEEKINDKKTWANLKEENGLDGGWGSGQNHARFGKKHSEDTKKLYREQRKGKITGSKNPNFNKKGELNHFYGIRGEAHHNFGIKRSKEFKSRLSLQNKGKKKPKDFGENLSKRQTGSGNHMHGKSWYTNGLISKAYAPYDVPEGYVKGRKLKC